MKGFDLEPQDWKSDRREPEPKSKYPRKTIFGLTDYGPPPFTGGMFIGIVVMWIVIVVGREVLAGRLP